VTSAPKIARADEGGSPASSIVLRRGMSRPGAEGPTPPVATATTRKLVSESFSGIRRTPRRARRARRGIPVQLRVELLARAPARPAAAARGRALSPVSLADDV
jgi:hypothetical protein